MWVNKFFPKKKVVKKLRKERVKRTPKFMVTYEVRERNTSPIIKGTVITTNVEEWFKEAKDLMHSVAVIFIIKL